MRVEKSRERGAQGHQEVGSGQGVERETILFELPWGHPQHMDAGTGSQDQTLCFVLWLSQSAQDLWEESGGHPVRGSPNQHPPQSVVTAPSSLS